jgi:hypothetical protein
MGRRFSVSGAGMDLGGSDDFRTPKQRADDAQREAAETEAAAQAERDAGAGE